jgi:hypothetical protein
MPDASFRSRVDGRQVLVKPRLQRIATCGRRPGKRRKGRRTKSYTVSRAVNNVKNDNEECITPVEGAEAI